MNEYFINQKKKLTWKLKRNKWAKKKKKNKEKGLNMAEWRAKRKRKNVHSRSLWTLVVRIFVQNGGALLSFTFNRRFHAYFLSISKRQVLCGPEWKIPRLHPKIFFPPSLPNNIKTHFLFIIFHPLYFTFNQTYF